jgi:hypothetical protein
MLCKNCPSGIETLHCQAIAEKEHIDYTSHSLLTWLFDLVAFLDVPLTGNEFDIHKSLSSHFLFFLQM